MQGKYVIIKYVYWVSQLLLLRLLLHLRNLVVSPLLHLMPLVLFSLDH